MSTEKILELSGKSFKISAGAETVKADDDKMVRIYPIYYVLNGGANNSLNSKSYYQNGDGNITLYNPSKTNAVFGGWYDNAGFTGAPITEIDTSKKEEIKIYAKWQ
jgi:uncharacterized repeat protein (TIGR02543 family)